jgi:hypothetical protein
MFDQQARVESEAMKAIYTILEVRPPTYKIRSSWLFMAFSRFAARCPCANWIRALRPYRNPKIIVKRFFQILTDGTERATYLRPRVGER